MFHIRVSKIGLAMFAALAGCGLETSGAGDEVVADGPTRVSTPPPSQSSIKPEPWVCRDEAVPGGTRVSCTRRDVSEGAPVPAYKCVPQSGEERCPPPRVGDDDGYTCTFDGFARVCQGPATCSPGTYRSLCGECVKSLAEDTCAPVLEGCTASALATIKPSEDGFGGVASPVKSGGVRGEWSHNVKATGDKAHAEITYLTCRASRPNSSGPGPRDKSSSVAYFGGPARWFTAGAWAAGYWLDVVADGYRDGKIVDDGDPATYEVTVRAIDAANQSGAIVYQARGDLSAGKLSVHPPNAGQPASLGTTPTWVIPGP